MSSLDTMALCFSFVYLPPQLPGPILLKPPLLAAGHLVPRLLALVVEVHCAETMAVLIAVSVVPAELCEDLFYLLLCAGNLVPEDFEESGEEPVRRTQIYQFSDIGCQANGPKSGQAAHT